LIHFCTNQYIDCAGFTSFPALATELPGLRQLEFEYEQEIFFLRSEERVNKYLVAPIAQSLEEVKGSIQQENYKFKILNFQ